jgi:hypothetical protein
LISRRRLKTRKLPKEVQVEKKIRELMKLTRQKMYINAERDFKEITEYLEFISAWSKMPKLTILEQAKECLLEYPNSAVVQAFDKVTGKNPFYKKKTTKLNRRPPVAEPQKPATKINRRGILGYINPN